jgi:hypothetical protein
VALDLTDATDGVRRSPARTTEGLDVLLDSRGAGSGAAARLIIAGREGSETPRLQAALRGHRRTIVSGCWASATTSPT